MSPNDATAMDAWLAGLAGLGGTTGAAGVHQLQCFDPVAARQLFLFRRYQADARVCVPTAQSERLHWQRAQTSLGWVAANEAKLGERSPNRSARRSSWYASGVALAAGLALALLWQPTGLLPSDGRELEHPSSLPVMRGAEAAQTIQFANVSELGDRLARIEAVLGRQGLPYRIDRLGAAVLLRAAVPQEASEAHHELQALGLTMPAQGRVLVELRLADK